MRGPYVGTLDWPNFLRLLVPSSRRSHYSGLRSTTADSLNPETSLAVARFIELSAARTKKYLATSKRNLTSDFMYYAFREISGGQKVVYERDLNDFFEKNKFCPESDTAALLFQAMEDPAEGGVTNLRFRQMLGLGKNHPTTTEVPVANITEVSAVSPAAGIFTPIKEETTSPVTKPSFEMVTPPGKPKAEPKPHVAQVSQKLQFDSEPAAKKDVKPSPSPETVQKVSGELIMDLLQRELEWEETLETLRGRLTARADFSASRAFELFEDTKGQMHATLAGFMDGLVELGVVADVVKANNLFARYDTDQDELMKYSDFVRMVYPREQHGFSLTQEQLSPATRKALQVLMEALVDYATEILAMKRNLFLTPRFSPYQAYMSIAKDSAEPDISVEKIHIWATAV